MSRKNESRVLVTGGGGFIGSHIVDRLLEGGYQVGVLDNFTTGERSNLRNASAARLHEGDICSLDFVRGVVRNYDAIIHEAALVSVTRSVEDPVRTSRVNIDGTLNLLVAAREFKLKKFVYASSSSVYGETETLPRRENLSPAPVSPYAVSKLAAENYCRVFARVNRLPTVCLRYFNVYGPRQKLGQYSGVIPIFVGRVKNDEPPVIFGDGLQTRDFTFVEDVVTANLLALESNLEPGEVFNIAAGEQITLNTLASSIAKLMNKPELHAVYAPPRKGDVRYSYSDISKARKMLGFSPSVALNDGLRKVIDWFAGAGLPSLPTS